MLVAVGLAPAAAPASSKHPVKPSIKVAGLSVNQQNFSPGTRVTAKSPINACYYIAGPTGSPRTLTLVAFVHAVGIPRSAPGTLKLTTPWATQGLAKQVSAKDKFSKLVSPDRGHGVAALFGGGNGPNDYFRYDQFPGGYPSPSVIDGRYGIDVTVKVNGKTLTTHGAITINCFH